MSLADEIRSMSDERLAEFLVWDVPDVCEDCDHFENGCAWHCPRNRKTDRMLDLLTKE